MPRHQDSMITSIPFIFGSRSWQRTKFMLPPFNGEKILRSLRRRRNDTPSDVGQGNSTHRSPQLLTHQRFIRWRQNVASINGAFMGFILGGFGLSMTREVFWICWGLLITEAILLYSMQPKIDVRPGETPRLTYQDGIGFNTIFWLKTGLIIALIIFLRYHNRFTYCGVDSSCFSRLRESLWAMVALYCLEVLLIILPRLLSNYHGAFKTRFIIFLIVKLYPSRALNQTFLDIYRLAAGRGALSLKDIFSDILSLSSKTNSSLWDWIMWDSTKSSFVPSSVAVGLFVTVGALVGNNFGTFMTKKSFWLCWCSLLVELIAEIILQIDSVIISNTQNMGSKNVENARNNKEAQRTSKTLVKVTWAVRFFLQGPVFALMVDMIFRGNDYFAVDMTNCDGTCQARGRELIYVCCIASGFQCFSFLTSGLIWYGLRVPLFLNHIYLALCMIGVPVFLSMGFLCVVYILLSIAGLVDRVFCLIFCRQAQTRNTTVMGEQRTDIVHTSILDDLRSMDVPESNWHVQISVGKVYEILLCEISDVEEVIAEVSAQEESIAQTSIPHVPVRMASRRTASQRERAATP